MPLLSILLILPALTAVLIGFVPEKSARLVALGGSLLTFLVSLGLFGVIGQAPGTFALEYSHTWLTNLHVTYHLGVDGAAALLILLSTFLQIFAVAYSFENTKERVREYYICLMILEA